MILFTAMAACSSGCGQAASPAGDGPSGFVHHRLQQADGESKYVVFVPHDYDGNKPYPLILFLHGLGQSGDDGEAQIRRGLAKAVRERERTFPFLVVFPQSQQRSWTADSVDGKRAMAILDEVTRNYRVDERRMYLTGYSMGGEGTFHLAAAHADRWAAIVPICGSGDVEQAAQLKDIPSWCFVGDADAANTVFHMRSMVSAIKQAGGRPIYHEFPGVGHDCWDLVYANDDLYDWLLEQRRQ